MGYQNIGPNYWHGEDGRQALIAGKEKLTDEQWVAPFKRTGQVEALSRRRLRGADLSRQPEPVLARPRRDLSGRLVGHHHLRGQHGPQDGRLPAAGAEGRRHLLHLRPHRHRHGHQRGEQAPGSGQDVPDWMASADFATLYANALPGFFPLSNARGEDRGSAGAGIRFLAQGLQVDHPVDLRRS